MNIFFDIKFTGLYQDTTLISIGCVTEDLVAKDGKVYEAKFYGESLSYDCNQVDEWTAENVIRNLAWAGSLNPSFLVLDNHIENTMVRAVVESQITELLETWLKKLIIKQPESHLCYGKNLKNGIQFIGDCLSYDWVLLCDLFDGALNLPDFISPAPHDINQDIAEHLNISNRHAFDIDRTEFIGYKKLQALVRVFCLPEFWGKDLSHNACFNAMVIKACYEKLEYHWKSKEGK